MIAAHFSTSSSGGGGTFFQDRRQVSPGLKLSTRNTTYVAFLPFITFIRYMCPSLASTNCRCGDTAFEASGASNSLPAEVSTTMGEFSGSGWRHFWLLGKKGVCRKSSHFFSPKSRIMDRGSRTDNQSRNQTPPLPPVDVD